MLPIVLTIPGEPCGQPRVKATIRGRHAAVYTPSTVKDSTGASKPHPAAVFKAGVKAAWGIERPAIDGPVSLIIEAVFPRPSNKRWKSKPMPSYPHTSKPDGDNVAKAVLDALNGLAYRDDSQVFWLSIYKRVAAGDEVPFTRVTIEPRESIP